MDLGAARPITVMNQPREVGVSVLIVNWNSKDYLDSCLQSLRTHEASIPMEIVVVDSGSYDGCGEMMSRKHPAARFVQLVENVGFGRANNAGFAFCTREALLLLNPDTEVCDGAVRTLYRELRSGKDAGIVGARLIGADGTVQAEAVRSLPTAWNRAFDIDLLRRAIPGARMWGTEALEADRTVEVEAVSGACMMMWAETYSAAGGFSPEFFLYGEDMDLCQKVQSMGLRVLHAPDATVVHHGGGSTGGGMGPRSAVLLHASTERYLAKHRGARSAAAFRFLTCILSLCRLACLRTLALLDTSRGIEESSREAALRRWQAVLEWSVGSGDRCGAVVPREGGEAPAFERQRQ
jgi:N-acetylglucosaminyl-diphospho-decaprenol L-rhamnosyltransferase